MLLFSTTLLGIVGLVLGTYELSQNQIELHHDILHLPPHGLQKRGSCVGKPKDIQQENRRRTSFSRTEPIQALEHSTRNSQTAKSSQSVIELPHGSRIKELKTGSNNSHGAKQNHIVRTSSWPQTTKTSQSHMPGSKSMSRSKSYSGPKTWLYPLKIPLPRVHMERPASLSQVRTKPTRQQDEAWYAQFPQDPAFYHRGSSLLQDDSRKKQLSYGRRFEPNA